MSGSDRPEAAGPASPAGRVRPRAVLVTPLLPARAGNGLAMRAGLALEGLARSFAVDVVVAPVLGDAGRDDGLTGAYAHAVAVLELPAADARTAVTELLATPGGRERAGALAPRPYLCDGLTPAAARELARRAEGAALVWVLRLYLAPLLDTLLDAPARPALAIDVDDLDADVARAAGDAAEADAFDRLAAYYLPRAALVTAAAGADAAELATRHGLAHAVALPNAVRPPERADDTAVSGAVIDHDLLFVGNLSYRPNVEAAVWLAEELAPRLPGARMAIVGSRPAPAVRALRGVTLAADVDDVAPWYARSRLAVAPLASGGGTRTKLVEALACRRAVVTTTAGAAGLEDLEGVVVADGADAFAAACRRLLADPAGTDELARAGECAVRERLTVARVAGTVDALARNMLTS